MPHRSGQSKITLIFADKEDVMEVAKIKINGTNAEVSELKTITSGMVGATVRIEYDDTWTGLNKQVVYKTDFQTINAEGAEIPPELLKICDTVLRVGVYGYTDDGTIVIPTVYAELGKIKPGADPEGDEAAKPTNPIWMEAITTSRNADGKAEAALEAAVSAESKADSASGLAASASDTAAAAAEQAGAASGQAEAASAAAESAARKAEAAEQTVNELEYAVTNHLADIDALIGGTGVSEINEII